MKKIGLGIAILLFAIILSLCSSGMGLLVIGIGIVGLIFSIIGFIERKSALTKIAVTEPTMRKTQV